MCFKRSVSFVTEVPEMRIYRPADAPCLSRRRGSENDLAIELDYISNYAFAKEVFVRFSWNNWLTWDEVRAQWRSDAVDGHSSLDYFVFEVPSVESSAILECTMKFCLRYRVADREYWDSNQGENYTIVTKQTAPLIKKGILRLSTTSIAPDTRNTESVIEFHRSRVATFMESNAQRRSLTDDGMSHASGPLAMRYSFIAALAAVDLRKSRRPPQFSGYANLLGNIGDMKRLSNSMAT
ncbi:hypothetical protein LTR56_027769 [Elasticomyces elasticus]|nr:hypothetical protein LTR56_027769 [Elasticomyces elasticus]